MGRRDLVAFAGPACRPSLPAQLAGPACRHGGRSLICVGPIGAASQARTWSSSLTGFGVPPRKKASLSGTPASPPAVAGHLRAPVLADEPAFAAALVALASLDEAFVARLRAAGAEPRLRRRAPGFEGLAAIVVAQQVSTASAEAIFARVQARFPCLDAAAIAAASDGELRVCGLSAGKTRTLRAIAEAVGDGRLDFAALAAARAEVAHAALCAIKGIGPWTADIFLLFCLGHGDAWPAGDLALQEAARLVLGLPARPDARALETLAERWRPLRGVVAHCLWAYYAVARARPATLESAALNEAALKGTAVQATSPATRAGSRTRRGMA